MVKSIKRESVFINRPSSVLWRRSLLSMRQHNASESRNCWNAARERERRKARFSIRERVASLHLASSNNDDNDLEQKRQQQHDVQCDNEKEEYTTVQTWIPTEHDVEQIKHYLRRVEAGATSTFSLAVLAKDYDLLIRPVPTDLLSSYKITTLCTSRFGKQETENVLECVKHLTSCTLMEYAAWLGEYRILGSLLVGGLDPTLRGTMTQSNDQEPEIMEQERGQETGQREQDQSWLLSSRRSQIIASRVLKRFFDAFPLPLKCYMVKRVIDMRKEGLLLFVKNDFATTVATPMSCPLCHCIPSTTEGTTETPRRTYLLCFGNPCFHVFCEACQWEDLLDHIDDRVDGDVVLCLVCRKSPRPEATTSSDDPNAHNEREPHDQNGSPAHRCRISLEKFNALPSNAKELKKLPTKKKKITKKGVLYSTWSEAVLSSLGKSQNVRRDRWFMYAERNASHHIRGCLVAGIDINMRNEYGQTALYIAGWRGFTDVVDLLLQYGADASICASGGSSVRSISMQRGHVKVIELLKQHTVSAESKDEGHEPFKEWLSQQLQLQHQQQQGGEVGGESKTTDAKLVLSQNMTLTRLIDLSLDHPGAGAFFIDNSLPPSIIDELSQVWRSIPEDKKDKDKKNRQELCSIRSYYCDAGNVICQVLTKSILQCCHGDWSQSAKEPIVFAHMRFLHYAHPGGELAPHVDLSRVNHDGYRSTHTFILYLYDCKHGGETSLLKDFSGERKVLAKVSPRRGRLLVFPHSCPHEGNEVQSVPKVLLRGEVMLPT